MYDFLKKIINLKIERNFKNLKHKYITIWKYFKIENFKTISIIL